MPVFLKRRAGERSFTKQDSEGNYRDMMKSAATSSQEKAAILYNHKVFVRTGFMILDSYLYLSFVMSMCFVSSFEPFCPLCNQANQFNTPFGFFCPLCNQDISLFT